LNCVLYCCKCLIVVSLTGVILAHHREHMKRLFVYVSCIHLFINLFWPGELRSLVTNARQLCIVMHLSLVSVTPACSTWVCATALSVLEASLVMLSVKVFCSIC
jgi:hypothetical protein